MARLARRGRVGAAAGGGGGASPTSAYSPVAAALALVCLDLLHGFAAGCASQLLMLPFETVVTRLQTKSLVGGCAASTTNSSRGGSGGSGGSGGGGSGDDGVNGCNVIAGVTASSGWAGGSAGAGACGSRACASLFSSLFSSQASSWTEFSHAVAEVHAEGGLPRFYASLVPALLICINPSLNQVVQVRSPRDRFTAHTTLPPTLRVTTTDCSECLNGSFTAAVFVNDWARVYGVSLYVLLVRACVHACIRCSVCMRACVVRCARACEGAAPRRAGPARPVARRVRGARSARQGLRHAAHVRHPSLSPVVGIRHWHLSLAFVVGISSWYPSLPPHLRGIYCCHPSLRSVVVFCRCISRCSRAQREVKMLSCEALAVDLASSHRNRYPLSTVKTAMQAERRPVAAIAAASTPAASAAAAKPALPPPFAPVPVPVERVRAESEGAALISAIPKDGDDAAADAATAATSGNGAGRRSGCSCNGGGGGGAVCASCKEGAASAGGEGSSKGRRPTLVAGQLFAGQVLAEQLSDFARTWRHIAGGGSSGGSGGGRSSSKSSSSGGGAGSGGLRGGVAALYAGVWASLARKALAEALLAIVRDRVLRFADGK